MKAERCSREMMVDGGLVTGDAMAQEVLRIQCVWGDTDAVSELSLGFGALSVSLEYPEGHWVRTQQRFGVGRDKPEPDQKRCIVSMLLPEHFDSAALLEKISTILDWDEIPSYTLEPLGEKDWVRESHERLQPILIGKRLWVVPSWHSPPEPEGIILSIDPGLAFGTGGHPTTRLCLHWLEQNINGGEKVIDYGCGSGILAIAALKLGAGTAMGVVIDPHALETSRANACRNGVALPLFRSDQVPQTKADIVLANILANPLRVLASNLIGYARPGAHVVMSGLIVGQESEIIDVFEQWFDFASPIIDEEWVCLAGKRRS
jgi:ribosomal protein L11 methyltransferase